jgi:hypothetical protein
MKIAGGFFGYGLPFLVTFSIGDGGGRSLVSIRQTVDPVDVRVNQEPIDLALCLYLCGSDGRTVMRIQHERGSTQERRQSLSPVEVERRSGEDQRVLQRDDHIDRDERTLAEPYFEAMARRRRRRVRDEG